MAQVPLHSALLGAGRTCAKGFWEIAQETGSRRKAVKCSVVRKDTPTLRSPPWTAPGRFPVRTTRTASGDVHWRGSDPLTESVRR